MANPVPELLGLRTASIASETVTLPATGAHAVPGTGAGAAASADVELNFTGWASASAPVTFGACVLGAHGLGLTITVDPAAKTATVTAGACPGSDTSTAAAALQDSPRGAGEANVTRMMNDTNFPHGDIFDREFPTGTGPAACQALCDNTTTCGAWTFLRRGRGMACCIKG